jgi:hypothetical protein
MRSLGTVIPACIMILLTVYVFACIGIEMMVRSATLTEDPDTTKVIQNNFSSLPVAMATLIQFASGDSMADIYKPLVKKVWYLAIYFGAVWLAMTITLMNLITAVIVDNAITESDADRERERHMKRKRLRALQPTIKQIFQELINHASMDGPCPRTSTDKICLSISGMRSALRGMLATRTIELPADIREILHADRLVEVCDYLDFDRSGEIDEDEFTNGIFSLMLQAVPIETTQMLQLLRSQSDALRRLQRDIKRSSQGQSRGSQPSSVPGLAIGSNRTDAEVATMSLTSPGTATDATMSI